MSIEGICQKSVDLAATADTAQDAALRMKSRNVGSLLVLDAQRRPLGILTARDLAVQVVGHARDSSEMSVGELMTKHPRTITMSTSVQRALALMRSEGRRRLPVVDTDGKLVGVVTLDDVLSLIASEFCDLGALLQHDSPQGDADAPTD